MSYTFQSFHSENEDFTTSINTTEGEALQWIHSNPSIEVISVSSPSIFLDKNGKYSSIITVTYRIADQTN